MYVMRVINKGCPFYVGGLLPDDNKKDDDTDCILHKIPFFSPSKMHTLMSTAIYNPHTFFSSPCDSHFLILKEF